MRVKSGFTLLILAVVFVATSFNEDSDRDLMVKRVNLIIREIGHRLLLQAGDSTSRVLPVTEVKEGTFVLSFENEFVFSHDSLMALSKNLLPKKQFPSGYTVTVHDCSKDDIVYGFQVNNHTPDILACGGRKQPRGCYTIEFAIADIYENVKKQKAAIVQPYKSSKTDFEEVTAKPELLKTAPLQSGSLITSSSNNPTNPLSYLVISGILLLFGARLLIGRFEKILQPLPALHQDPVIVETSVPELDALGKFLLNRKEQLLLLGNESISLTDKEYKVLDLLHKNFGELIPRETLMQEVWINEGVITGRSLDMFVSKLRKKLSGDPELSITNIHGKGYKLEMIGGQIV
ncbi:MAG: winged helix-turn-helix domain-containing protein [Agriterribacter sp.]